MRKTRQITFEKHSVTLIRTNEIQRPTHCQHCGEPVANYAAEQIATFEQAHLTGKDDDAPICGESLNENQEKLFGGKYNEEL